MGGYSDGVGLPAESFMLPIPHHVELPELVCREVGHLLFHLEPQMKERPYSPPLGAHA